MLDLQLLTKSMFDHYFPQIFGISRVFNHFSIPYSIITFSKRVKSEANRNGEGLKSPFPQIREKREARLVHRKENTKFRKFSIEFEKLER